MKIAEPPVTHAYHHNCTICSIDNSIISLVDKHVSLMVIITQLNFGLLTMRPFLQAIDSPSAQGPSGGGCPAGPTSAGSAEY